MIVKDEEHVIRATLEHLVKQITFSYWVICDTGSTDKTREIITDFFKEQNIPGELLQHEWKDFGHNRTLALQGAFKKADYIFIFDADDTIHGTIKIPKLTHDFYKMKFGSGFTYYRPLLVTAHKPTKFVGVLHEFLSLEEGRPSESSIEGDYYIDSGKTGSRSRDKDKYLKDANILKAAYQKEVETNGGLMGRYAFYCAQSFKDCNHTDDAIEWYTLVADKLNNWVQERYYSCLMLGFLYKGKGNFQKALEYFLKAEQFDSDRAEGIIFAVEMVKEAGIHTLAVLLYEKYKNYNKNPQDKLFLYRDMYNDVFEFNAGISAYMTNNRKLSYDCCKKIILNNIANPAIRDRTFKNMRFHMNELNDDPDTLSLFYHVTKYIQTCDEPKETTVVWNMLFKKNREHLTKPSKFKPTKATNNRVFFSITSCKRLDLFRETVNSILNHWTDVDEIDYWFCVDDNSSKEDRQAMKKSYPWFNFHMKGPEEKGHRESMNIIWNKLKEVKPRFWIHMEDDFLFHIKRSYVDDSINLLQSHPDIKQVLFNRGYSETVADVDMRGYLPLTPGYVVHDYKEGQFSYKNCHYWPHYSFRPSLIDVDVILKLGNYDSPNTFFERDYADKWMNAGYKSAFFDMVCCRHIGRLTSDRNNKDVKNAYDLNNENQFNQPKSMKVVNLKRRPDRKVAVTTIFKKIGFTDYEFFEAVDGKQLKPTSELKKLFAGNDFGNGVGVIGCALSHYNLWRSLLASNEEYYVIFEDDVILSPSFKRVYEGLKTQRLFNTQEYMLLGYHMIKEHRNATLDVYVKDATELQIAPLHLPFYIGGTFGYSINRTGARKLVDFIEKNGIKHGIDYVVKICTGLEIKELRPQIVFSDWYQHSGYSVDTDIQTERQSLNFDNIMEDNFTFYPGLDVIGSDLFYKPMSVSDAMSLTIDSFRCGGFNTLGFFKGDIDTTKLQKSKYFGPNDGIYVKHKPGVSIHSSRPRIKMICDWKSSSDYVNDFKRGCMPITQFDITSSDDADYFVIVNKPRCGEYYDPSRTIILQMEPWVYDDSKPWGVKTWGEWANPSPTKFMHVNAHRNYLNPANWSLGGDLVNLPPKDDKVVAIFSDKKTDIGHTLRIEFVRDTPKDTRIDVYGSRNHHNIDSYVGPVPGEDRYNLYSKYKYVIAAENNFETNYATEKIWEPIISESLPFYWGCPNLEDHIDPRSFVRLPLEDPAKAAEIVRKAVEEDWWSQRIDAIRAARKKIMDEMGIFSVIHKIISKSKFYSQDGQDAYLEANVFKGFKNGVFMDVGAHDGIKINNTLFFEKERGWSGVNVEPNKTVYDKLVLNRPSCINLNCAVANEDGTAEFICNEGYTEMLSGLKNHYDPRHHKRLNNEIGYYGGKSSVINTPVKKIDTICSENNISRIHYLSIDVEGGEFDVIRSINFNSVFIDVIGFENNYNDTSIPIVQYLTEKGYTVIHSAMDIFMKHSKSMF
jgi:FkbM family methyltransferase